MTPPKNILKGQVNLDSLSNEDLVLLYSTSPAIYEFGDNRVVRISDDLVLKGGSCVTPGEPETQLFAASIGLPVPTVHRVFSRPREDALIPDEQGWYIVMDFVPGQPLEKAWDQLDAVARSNVAVQVAELTQQMQTHSITDMPPGPVGGSEGEPWNGPWFTDYGAGPFETLQEMEDWYNHKIDVCLRLHQTSPDIPRFQFDDLVLTHMDIAPRNLILDNTSKDLWIIDWARGGIYPVGFEQATLAGQLRGQDDVKSTSSSTATDSKRRHIKIEIT
ncbi:C6 zinc finger domain protein [Seiridium cupressi]